jgi:hypothetical protein
MGINMEDQKNIETPTTTDSQINGDSIITPFSMGTECVTSKKCPISTTLIVIYLVLMLISSYWYWSRPVRADQFGNAYTWWRGVADVYHFPVPSDETWQ